jgi:hypothetical protein
VAADRLGVDLGDAVGVFGEQFRVSGQFRGGTTIANSIAFITTSDFAASVTSRKTCSFTAVEKIRFPAWRVDTSRAVRSLAR